MPVGLWEVVHVFFILGSWGADSGIYGPSGVPPFTPEVWEHTSMLVRIKL